MLNSLYFINSLLFNFCVSFYLISALQWYSYKLNRIVFHYHKPLWHLYFLLCPYLMFLVFPLYSLIYFIILAPILYFWNKNIDKKLIFTNKVKWFFVFVFIYNTLFAILALRFSFLFNLCTLILALLSLKIYDLFSKIYYKKQAKSKLNNLSNLKIILITASFGKTSIKNFLYELLKDDFKVYKTPRSVNTLMGIVADINNNLNQQTQIYIAEAGARLKGDIDEITRFLEPQICIIGEIGNAHLEYFKNIDNIRQTKLEALNSKRLEKAFLHTSTLKKENEIITLYDNKINNINSNLEGLKFEISFKQELHTFKSQILGEFNAQNLCVCILCANYLGINFESIKNNILNIKSVEHRLQIISKKPKFIIDDGFNGNFKGMSESYRLCKLYKGRKVLVSPGIMEVSKEENIKLAQIINDCFDLAIITANINAEIFEKELSITKIILKEKSELVNVLAKETKNGDLILFSNDAPSFM
ncbi:MULTISPECIES: UDP-N-acetylmuramoyl-tripeptide--D-alanyl-D-alanine ligase [Campylobacter]|uniref:UDP-N-acetylmuramoyl-tripeptide--D-alanyl-D- alanine ligase n=1 Tax=Campylobacter TaxID=194 RepID=UPI001DF81859|nr:UDP-N-acetylmuramoyl-tripeptide--D-alanyl-D-alanine ligase [Campylobacter sp. W0065]MBZ7937062.1 UDP-N-acetylmuramoyl-tripeptide--D-alanyl-D-alanine ligase [Campylobacter sp. RM10538]MBZ7959682.1 UDP-N-acetylmuramoyl-tripeptide--D-alanyl-D-alanine ligase [Campylobacter sp. RM12397]MBZ7972817.1 UDP-N-acetylmuramoyl-tripeptide--D-alanyl-D-alanine ligase [Campylobacter sp. RM9753]